MAYTEEYLKTVIYSGTALLALLVHVIIHYAVIRGKQYRNDTPASKAYRGFILSVMLFYAADTLWYILYAARLTAAVFADTMVYFAAMTASVFLWTRYVIHYLNGRGGFITILSWTGWVLMAYMGIALVLNLFVPVMFRFDGEGNYHAEDLRYAALAIQVLMFMSTSVYVLVTAARKELRERHRYAAIGTFGIVMTAMVVLQVAYPLLPMYSIGCLLGTSILHTFVLGDMMEDRRQELEEMVRKERQQKLELGSARYMAYTDSLTGVKNTHAYVEAEQKVDARISDGKLKEFGVVVFDVNGLKTVNDTKGHDAGDQYIQDACRTICRLYKHSPIYRIGGDEFVAILEGEDYEKRKNLLVEFDGLIEDNLRTGRVVVASGMAIFRPGQDNSYRRVFERADQRMYDRKGVLKSLI